MPGETASELLAQCFPTSGPREVSKYRNKLQIPFQISRKFLSGNFVILEWFLCTPSCSVFRFFKMVGISALLVYLYYVASSGNPLPTFWDNLSVPPSRVKTLRGVCRGMKIDVRCLCMEKGLGNTALHECFSNLCINVQVTNLLVNRLCGVQSAKADRHWAVKEIARRLWIPLLLYL
jgi:hypothetical protein